MNEVTIGDHTYQIGRLAALNQFHVVRRLGPVMAAMGESITSLMSAGKSLKNDGDLLAVMGAASEVMARMSNEDAEYIINSCLSVVKRQQGERWMAVMTGKSFQFQDIDMQLMLRLTVEVLKENLAGFFPQAPVGSSTSEG